MDDQEPTQPRMTIADPKGFREEFCWMCCAKRDDWPPPEGSDKSKVSPMASTTAPTPAEALRAATPPKQKKQADSDEKPKAGFRLSDMPWKDSADARSSAYSLTGGGGGKPKAAKGPPPPPAKVVFLHASQTGKGSEIARYLHADAVGRGMEARVLSVGELGFHAITPSDTPLVVFVASSTGVGEAPDSAATFYHNLTTTKSPGLLKGVRFAILGLGSSNYSKFMKVPRTIKIRMLALGAKMLCPAGEADAAKPNEREVIDEWCAALWEPLESAFGELKDAVEVYRAGAKPGALALPALGLGGIKAGTETAGDDKARLSGDDKARLSGDDTARMGTSSVISGGDGGVPLYAFSPKGSADKPSASPMLKLGSKDRNGSGGSGKLSAFAPAAFSATEESEMDSIAAEGESVAASAAVAATATSAASPLPPTASPLPPIAEAGRQDTVQQLANDTNAALENAGNVIKTVSQTLADEVDAVAAELGLGEEITGAASGGLSPLPSVSSGSAVAEALADMMAAAMPRAVSSEGAATAAAAAAKAANVASAAGSARPGSVQSGASVLITATPPLAVPVADAAPAVLPGTDEVLVIPAKRGTPGSHTPDMPGGSRVGSRSGSRVGSAQGSRPGSNLGGLALAPPGSPHGSPGHGMSGSGNLGTPRDKARRMSLSTKPMGVMYPKGGEFTVKRRDEQEYGLSGGIAPVGADLRGAPPLLPPRARLSWEKDAAVAQRVKAAEAARPTPEELACRDPEGCYSPSAPFFAAVAAARYETAAWSDRTVLHLELDLSGSGMAYEAGDAVGVVPTNTAELVAATLKKLGRSGDAVLAARPVDGGDHQPLAHLPCPCTLGYALTHCVDLTSPAPRSVLRLLAEHAKDPSEKRTLMFLTSRAGADAYAHEIGEHQPSLPDLLARFPSVGAPPIDALLDVLPPLAPRLYSATTSPAAAPSSVQIALSVVRFKTRYGSRAGVASNWLDRLVQPLLTGDTPQPSTTRIPIFLRRTPDFKPPKDLSAPLVMVGPGTGVAPFRGFLQARKAAAAAAVCEQGGSGEAAVGTTVLYFGCRREDEDYLYRDDLAGFAADGTLSKMRVAFSRAQEKKVYVQDLMRADAAELCELLRRGAYVFVCGDGSGMAADVHATLLDALKTHGGLNDAEADAQLREMAAAKRYVRDVWS